MLRLLCSPYILAKEKVFLRKLLLIMLFIIAGILFWLNFEVSIKDIQYNKLLIAESILVTKEERRELFSFFTFFKKAKLGTLVVHIKKREVYLPELQDDMVFIGISDVPEQTTVIFPQNLKKNLPQGTKRKVEAQIFSCIQNKDKSLPCCVIEGLEIVRSLIK